MSTLKGHPLFGLAPPEGKLQDYANHCRMYWFDEMIRGSTTSNLRWEWSKLGVCPVTGKLMYMNGYYPVSWIIIQENDELDRELYKAYEQWLIAKHLLEAT
jgi:hypothetical protein